MCLPDDTRAAIPKQHCVTWELFGCLQQDASRAKRCCRHGCRCWQYSSSRRQCLSQHGDSSQCRGDAGQRWLLVLSTRGILAYAAVCQAADTVACLCQALSPACVDKAIVWLPSDLTRSVATSCSSEPICSALHLLCQLLSSTERLQACLQHLAPCQQERST